MKDEVWVLRLKSELLVLFLKNFQENLKQILLGKKQNVWNYPSNEILFVYANIKYAHMVAQVNFADQFFNSNTYLSLSATKMTLRSSSSEAKTRITCRTLRHLNRLSKSTCSSRESVGRLNSMTWVITESVSLIYWVHFAKVYWANGRKQKAVVFCCACACSSDLISCTGKEGFYFDNLPWSGKGGLHQTPHEGIDQSCWDASPSLYLIQDLKRGCWQLMETYCCGFKRSWLSSSHFLFWKIAKASISMPLCEENSTQCACLPVLVQAASCLESWLGNRSFWRSYDTNPVALSSHTYSFLWKQTLTSFFIMITFFLINLIYIWNIAGILLLSLGIC